LFTLLFTIIDFGQLFYSNLTMQHAVREGTRYAVTGNTDLADDQASANARCDAAIAKIREQSMGLFDSMNSQVEFKTVQPGGAVVSTGGGCYSAGDIIVIQVTSQAPVLTPWLQVAFGDTVFEFDVSTTMKNESFN
jgi:Flp pilus assembly protein TadG